MDPSSYCLIFREVNVLQSMRAQIIGEQSSLSPGEGVSQCVKHRDSSLVDEMVDAHIWALRGHVAASDMFCLPWFVFCGLISKAV